LAHECGHRAFVHFYNNEKSESNLINDSVGLVLHSLLLVPYHSWRITHGLHHAYTSHMDKDQVFLPTEKNIGETKPDDTIIEKVFQISGMLFVGWFLYLLFNLSGNRTVNKQKIVNHFNPNSALFHPRHYWYFIKLKIRLIVISDLALVLVLFSLTLFGLKYGFLCLLKHYILPYLVVNYYVKIGKFLVR
jgi:omega-6 fatty acid desaturase / acyl-lipid omega-6 desaturase (Delta-12 desaturase)